MRIGVDVMGGDHAPDAILAGCLDAVGLLSDGDQLVLIGDEALIREALVERSLKNDPRIAIESTTQVIGMAETPVTALRSKPDSSIVRMGWLGSHRAGDRRCDVIISAGNTGACVASAQMSMRRLPGVNRPGIAVTIPTFFGPIILSDVGANPEPKPHHLHQYGHMASIYARKVVGIENPRVALLSIGGEEGKGTPLVKDTAKLMRSDKTLNYVGNVEGRDLFDGHADIVVTEGFTGNVVLKLAEGLAAGLFKTIAHELFQFDPELAMKFEPIVKTIYKKHDYHEYGGAPLLGTNGICMICHGSSQARTIVAAIRNSIEYARKGVNEAIVETLSKLEAQPADEPVK
ncbi:MAG: phosphate acyltransferase PlsX [Planctomycetes bacterium]|nr:phosphate acyltransferase PlsX [Planctomycetota bacterium]